MAVVCELVTENVNRRTEKKDAVGSRRDETLEKIKNAKEESTGR